MRNKLIPLWNKMMQCKHYIAECINELLKNKTNLVHSLHCSVPNFLMNLCAALTAYCLFENKPKTLPYILKRVGNWNCSKQILIPNWNKRNKEWMTRLFHCLALIKWLIEGLFFILTISKFTSERIPSFTLR